MTPTLYVPAETLYSLHSYSDNECDQSCAIESIGNASKSNKANASVQPDEDS
jgi:hypothetical protein